MSGRGHPDPWTLYLHIAPSVCAINALVCVVVALLPGDSDWLCWFFWGAAAFFVALGAAAWWADRRLHDAYRREREVWQRILDTAREERQP